MLKNELYEFSSVNVDQLLRINVNATLGVFEMECLLLFLLFCPVYKLSGL